MNKEEIKEFIALHYNTYINKIVHFKSSGLTARVKAIEPIEGDNGEYDAYCYLENPDEKDPSFKDHIYAHLGLQTVIDEGRLIL